MHNTLDLRDFNFLVLKAEKKKLMNKYERLRELALAFAGGTQLQDEFTSLYYGLKQIEQEEEEL